MKVKWKNPQIELPKKSGHVFVTSVNGVVNVLWFEAHVDQFWVAGTLYERKMIRAWAHLELPAPATATN